MNTRFNHIRRLSAAALALFVLLVLGTAPALADDDFYGSDAASRVGRRNGLDLGYEEGRRDALRGMRFDFRDDEYRDATAGYRPHLGSIWVYRAAFRDGYADGYRRAYHRFEDRHVDDHDESFEVQVGGIRFRWSDDDDDE